MRRVISTLRTISSDMTFWFNLGNSIVSFSFSLADVVSDIFNSMDLMKNTTQIQTTTLQPRTTIQPCLTTERIINERYLQLMKGNCDISDIHLDEYWGVIGFIIVFIPGILLLPPFLCGAIRQKDWRWFLIFLFLLPIYPVTLVVLQLLYVFSNFCQAERLTAISEIANIFIAMEAFFEAFGQLVLQGYTILYGYQAKGYFNFQQLISIGFSFLALSRVALMYDMAMKKVQMTLVETLCHTIEIFPCYAFTLIFRVMSLSLTIAYLRIWAMIPIGAIVLELFIISYMRYVEVEEKSRRFAFVYFAALSNVGVLNVNSFGELNGDKEDHKDDKDGRRFIRRSSIITFLHHSIVLSVILVLSQTHSKFFTEGKRACIILQPSLENGDPNPNFFWTISVTILIGFQGMMLSLANERKVSDVKKIDLLEEITQVVKSNKARTQNNGTSRQMPQTTMPTPSQFDIQFTPKLPQKTQESIQYDRQFAPKLPLNMPKPRYVNAKDTRGGTLPSGVVHSNVEKWRTRRSENL